MFERELNRVEPRGRPQEYKTYQITAPLGTHWRKATCAEVGCPDYLHGWRVRVEGLTPRLLHDARTSGRKHTEQHIAEGETWLVYEAGQPCFRSAEHRLRLEREEIYAVRDGDWRRSFGPVRRHKRPEWWLEDFATNQGRIHQVQQRG